MLSDATGFRKGSIALETNGFGGGRLVLSGAAQPVSGGTFSSPLVAFKGVLEGVDLAGVAFVSGATATVSGGLLTLRDGGYVASFHLRGGVGSAYAVESDGASGTLITPYVADPSAGAGAGPLVEAAATVTEAPLGTTSPAFAPVRPLSHEAFLARPPV